MPNLGLGERLRTRLRALGYWKNDRPDVARFALERGYRPQYIYAWLRDRVPDYENLIRLARDLNVTPDWLRFGAETNEQVAAAVGVKAPEPRTKRPPAFEPVTRGVAEPEAPRTGRVIEHPMLRLSELTGKLSRAEAELQDAIRAWKESEECFRRVFEEGPLGMGMADPEHRLIRVNRRYCEMMGYTEDELCRMTFLDITHPDDRALTLEMDTRLYQQELPYIQHEKRYLKKNGEVLYARVTVFIVNDKHGMPPNPMAMIEDITPQKLMEEELRRLAQQQELILQSVADGIYGTNEQGLACFVNPAAVRLLGWEASDLIGQHFHDFVHRQKPDGTPFPKEECPIVAAWGRLTMVRGSDQWCRKDGTMLAVEYVRAPIIRAGKVVGSVITFREQAGAVPELPAKDRRGPGTRKLRPRKGR